MTPEFAERDNIDGEPDEQFGVFSVVGGSFWLCRVGVETWMYMSRGIYANIFDHLCSGAVWYHLGHRLAWTF